MAFVDYYKIMGISKDTPQDQINAAYKKRVKQFHPDLHPDDPKAKAKFQALNEANEVLSDPQKRAQYDHFYPFAADWQEQSYGRIIVPGLGIYFLSPKEKDWEWGVVQRELCYIRQQQLGGQAYFRSQFLTDNTKGIYDYLHDSYYPYPALTPALTWLCCTPPEAPKVTTQERVNGVKEHLVWSHPSASPRFWVQHA